MRDLRLVDRTIVVKGQSKQKRPARGARGEFARARQLEADGLPVHANALVKAGASLNTQCYAYGPEASALGAARHFPPQSSAWANKITKSGETGIEVVRPDRSWEYAN